MIHLCNLRTARAVLGAMLLTLFAACSDVPSGLRQPGPNPSTQESAVARVADVPIFAEPTNQGLSGTYRTRRTVRPADGHEYIIETTRGTDGVALQIQVTRDGRPVARVVNNWQRAAGGYTLVRQQLVRLDGRLAVPMFDTRDVGGVSAVDAAPLTVKVRARGQLVPGSAGVTTANGGIRSLAADDYSDGGGCDSEARAAEAAIDEWLLSTLAVIGTTASGNVWAAWTAYAYQLKKYRDMNRSEAALDDCVARAGKRPDEL